MKNGFLPPIRLRAWVEDIRTSYWFLPAVLSATGLCLAVGLVYLDGVIGSDWLGSYAWLTGSRPEGARSVLSTIAGSTITVAGVVFSITLAAVTYASGQYGPRLLVNFQRDRGNQVSLGVFLASFLYCLIVLRTIRSAEEASADLGGVAAEAFVPHIAIYGAMALALASIAVLVYFVHHVTDSIHINSAIARIGRNLLHRIAERKPDLPAPSGFDESRACEIVADQSGYIEAIDEEALERYAKKQDLKIVLLRRPGDFVHSGWPLAKAGPADRATDGFRSDCTDAFAISAWRTPLQDLRFGIDELVEIAARALSPGVNDPFTAMSCIDWLGAVLSEMDRHPPPEKDADDGELRLFANSLKFTDYVEAAFGQLRTYAAADPIARAGLLRTLTEVAAELRDPYRRAAVLLERERLAEMPCGQATSPDVGRLGGRDLRKSL